MDIYNDWSAISKHFNRAFKSNLHVSIASVAPDGSPHVTPVGSLFLNDNQTGFYFEKFVSKIPMHAKSNNRIAVMAVDSGSLFWLLSLISGRFKRTPAIRLTGELGIKRKATSKELSRLMRKLSYSKYTKGFDLLWKDMIYVREVRFLDVDPIKLPPMT